MSKSTEHEDSFVEQTLLEHLNELRKRMTWAALALVIGTVVSFIFAQDILLFLLEPYNGQLQTLRPTEGIETFFKVALVSGVILSMPVILFQFWLFISPGLTKKERRYVYLFIPAALGLFLLGIAFAWFVLVPAAVAFLSSFMPSVFKTDWTGQEYIGFILAMLFWLGISFQMPIIIYVLSVVGLVSGPMMRDQWRVAVVGVAILAAAITPSIDPVTMLLTMAPLLVLYFLSIGLAFLGYRRFEKSMAID
ncbi:MAG: twin-arginine translocase subunit TatC [Chloroflexi bacterium]|nr:twin-arginine translocase subunit TatC [Chloroflexota bacterium]MBK6708816.1 twin-arginine translocase subunit TatC [Chloroflexota bacterium]MBK7179235.1 twin-arginine translocase subunit TatC [Chloroflexota bacterium]MBK7917172.1 twin-arginine translocase subunit TatC [Chloroflexota bacterium]MBK8934393.1 twin-arginine translocase subunit TatC [Chloroflexota bacterium]